MTTTYLNPPSVPTPAGLYSQGVLSSGPGEFLHIAGQVGVGTDGVIRESFAEQVDQAWHNLVGVLAAANMDVSHLVKVVTYLTDVSDAPVLREVRQKYLGTARPASTLLVIKELARPQYRVEIDAVAFKAV